MYETNVTLVGTLITAVDRRRLNDGTPVVSFRLVCLQRRYDRAADTWVDGSKLYASVTCWRRLAENVHASFVMGDPVIVHGRLHTREFEKDGQHRSVTEVEGTAVGPDLTRCTAALTRTRRANVAPPSATGEDGEAGQERLSGAAGAGTEPYVRDTQNDDALVEVGVGV